MPDDSPVTPKDLDWLKAELAKIHAILDKMRQKVHAKVYPQIYQPAADAIPINHAQIRTNVVIKSNKPTYATHWVEWRYENMTPVSSVARKPYDFNAANISIDLPVSSSYPQDYVLVCYIDGDDPASPSTCVHHVDKVPVTVS